MKSVFRFLALGLFAAASANAIYAQDVCADIEGQQAVYKRFTDAFDKDIPTRKNAVTAAKEYVEKYGACADAKAQVDYLKNYIPPTEEAIKKYEEGVVRDAIFKRFNAAMKSKNLDEVYAVGKEVIALDSEATVANDVTLLLGSIGYDESLKNNDKYNAETVRYAQAAISKLEAGKPFKDYGAGIQGGVGYTYKSNKNALGWMNYTIGYIKYYRDKDKKAAMPYLYQASQLDSAVKNKPEIYTAIGQYYLDQIVTLETARAEKLKASNNEDTDETKANLALQRGYADRGFDAYARAYKLIGTAPADKAIRDSIYARLKAAYEVRNGNATGLDAYISSVVNKPMPNPTTEVTPIEDAAPTTTTGSSTTPAAPATPAASAATTTTAKSAAANANTTATTAKPAPAPAKKPAPKKKGTR